jgi:hypothetical protein
MENQDRIENVELFDLMDGVFELGLSAMSRVCALKLSVISVSRENFQMCWKEGKTRCWALGEILW